MGMIFDPLIEGAVTHNGLLIIRDILQPRDSNELYNKTMHPIAYSFVPTIAVETFETPSYVMSNLDGDKPINRIIGNASHEYSRQIADECFNESHCTLKVL